MSAIKVPYEESKEEQETRFVAELEFVQCLSEPFYLHYLAQHGYFQDESFIAYLKYLLYWKQPKYAKFICFPHCFHFLDLLQSESFRKQLARREVVENIQKQQFYHWRYYRNNRLRSINLVDETGPQGEENSEASAVKDSMLDGRSSPSFL